MACPCDDDLCDDVHAHDVTGTFTVTLPPMSVMWPMLAEHPNLLRRPNGQ